MGRTKTPLSLQEAKWTQAARDEYFKSHPENFADRKNKAFPIRDQSDVGDAWDLAGHADDPDAVRAEVKVIAKRLGFTAGLPDTAKDDEKEAVASQKESASITSTADTPSRGPRSRIATIQVCWIEDGVRSLNGRIYPRETVDRLITSAQRKLSDPNALPVTCFLSHKDADEDHTEALIGKVTRIWREGTRGMASIDLADTGPARDALGLLAGGYICTESLRAKNAELRIDPHFDVPVVGGDQIELEGIDLTNYPGLQQVARVQQVHIAESQHSTIHSLTEVFALTDHALEIKESSMPEKLTEVAGGNMPTYTPAAGNTVGVTDDPTQDTYGRTMYKMPDMTTGPMQGMEKAPELMEAHDRIAMVQNRSCAPARESARWQSVYKTMTEQEKASITEAGKKLSGKNDAHLDAAHHAIAKNLKMACEGVNNKDPDHDGDDDSSNDPQKNPDWALDQLDKQNNMESTAQKGTRPMSKEEALRLLEAEGYDVRLERKKTEVELLREQLEASNAAHTQQLEEIRALMLQQQQASVQKVADTAPQRRSLVTGSNVDTHPNSVKNQIYQNGKYLREKITNADWAQLADRTCPLPEDMELDFLIKEFEQLYAVQYDDRFHILSAPDAELR